MNPFIILCDINMPVMSGLEMRELMWRSKEIQKKNTPFIFMSTSVRQHDIDKAATLSTQGFFQKEVSFVNHENLLRKIIDYWSCNHFPDPEAH